MPLPMEPSRAAPPGGRARRGPRAVLLVALALALAGCGLVLDGGLAFAAWVSAAVSGWAAGVHRRRRSAARPLGTASPVPRPAVPPDRDPLDRADLDDRLARLHASYVEQVNMCVAEGRDDLVQELSDGYVDRALQLMTGSGTPADAGDDSAPLP